MKSLLVACLVAFLPTVALAQSTPPPDSSTKAKPNEPVLARDHQGSGRIGVTLTFDKATGLPEITGLIRGGPACDFGFKVGDIIIKVDRNYTSTLSEDEVRLALHGEPGTGVELTVQRGDNPRMIVRAVSRRILPDYSEYTLDSAPPQPEQKP